jgi:hypothetical protein
MLGYALADTQDSRYKLYFFDPETELAIYPKIPVMLPFEK